MARELARNRSGEFVTTAEHAERDALVLRMLAQGMSYKDVVDAKVPGMANQGAVSKARRRALDAIKAPAVAEYRAEQLAKLDELERGAWDNVRDPGPKVSVTGRVVESPETGEPLPDNAVRDQARNTILKVIRQRADLLGLAAPRKSMSLQATMELDSENEALHAQLAEAYGAALAEKERELADLRAQLANAQPSGRPAPLALTAGKDTP
jgi:hypothetical protein